MRGWKSFLVRVIERTAVAVLGRHSSSWPLNRPKLRLAIFDFDERV